MIIYMMGLHLALCGGVGHSKLRWPGFNSQISTNIDEETGKEMLLYKDDPLKKTNQGGLGSRNSNKIFNVYRSANAATCPV